MNFLLPHRRLEGPGVVYSPSSPGRLSSDVTSADWAPVKLFFLQQALLREREFLWDLPGGPVVKIPCFHCSDHRLDSCSGAIIKISHAAV